MTIAARAESASSLTRSKPLTKRPKTQPVAPVPRLTLSLKEACEALGFGRNRVLGLVHGGKLGHLRNGRNILIPVSSLEEFIRQETRKGL
jgi:excisionase family DNA binding protein